MSVAGRGVTVDDLARLRWAMEPALHPETSAVAYVASGPDRALDGLGYELWVNSESGDRLFESGARAPRWSPAGDRLAFLRRSDGRWVPACRTLSGEDLAYSPPPGDAVGLRWAPGGPRLLVIASQVPLLRTHNLPFRVESSVDWKASPRLTAWIVEAGAEPVQVAPGLADVSLADWSPDGQRVALVSGEGVDRDTSIASGLWLWTPATGETECVVPPATPIHALAWSPDGSSVAFLASARNNSASALTELWALDVATGESTRLGADLDRHIGRAVRGDDERAVGAPILTWTPDSVSVLALYAEGGRSRLARFDMVGGWEDVIAGERCVLEFSHGAAGLAYSWSDPLTPGEVSFVDAAGTDHDVTDVGGDLLAEVELAPTKKVTVTASDGVEVEGWLTVPLAGSAGAPLVLQVHGGPHYPIGERFSFDAQRLAAQGLAVLRANPRGSHGYGQAFADGNLGDWGGRDFDDLLALVDQAVEVAGLDTDRVAVIGESYGGYMSAWAISSSDRFAAAVIESGISDFLSSAGGPVGPTFWYSEMGGAPWENPSLYLERSAITRFDRVTAPVLVIHCEADATCDIANGEAMYAALRELGRDAEFWRVPDEGHFFNVFGALSRRLERTRILDEFLVKHLGTG